MHYSKFISAAALLKLAAAAPATTQPAGGVVHARPASYDIPLTWTPLGFTGEFGFGTPAQKLPLFVDWTWISTYLLTTKCQGGTQPMAKCLAPTQKYFNQKASTSIEYVPDQYKSRNWNPNHFFWDKDLSVDYATEIQSVGPVSSKVVFQAADFHFDATTSPFPFAGVFGLSPVFQGDDASIQSTFYQMWTQGLWKSPHVAFHYCYNGSTSDVSKSTCKGKDGLQTVGSYDSNRIKGRMSWYDVIRFDEVNNVDFIYAPAIINYWTLKLEGMWIGDEAQKLNTTAGGSGAVFDHASYGRGAPMSLNGYKRLVSVTNAQPITLADTTKPNNGGGAFYQVDCAKTDSFPTLKYQFKGCHRVWEITPAHYVEKVNNQGKEVCVLNVRTLGTGDLIAGNFGETFSKDKYIVFDFQKLKVGISDLKW